MSAAPRVESNAGGVSTLISAGGSPRARLVRVSLLLRLDSRTPRDKAIDLIRGLRGLSGPVDPETLAALFASFSDTPICPVTARLTGRRRMVFEKLAHGVGRKQIAAELGLSEHTVNDYVKAVYRHFGVNSQAALMRRVTQRGR